MESSSLASAASHTNTHLTPTPSHICKHTHIHTYTTHSPTYTHIQTYTHTDTHTPHKKVYTQKTHIHMHTNTHTDTTHTHTPQRKNNKTSKQGQNVGMRETDGGKFNCIDVNDHAGHPCRNPVTSWPVYYKIFSFISCIIYFKASSLFPVCPHTSTDLWIRYLKS